MRYILLLALVASVVLMSGCASVRSGGGLVVELQADPPSVFVNSSTIIHIDVDNRQEKSVDNVVVELFDNGTFIGNDCIASFPRMLPNEFRSIACLLYSPGKIEEPFTESEVNVRTTFDSKLSAVQVFELVSEEEYERRSYGYSSAPSSYTYSDKNVRLDIEFSDQPPLVMRPGKEYFVYMTITNIGNGFIDNIGPGDLMIVPANPSSAGMLSCPVLEQRGILYPNGNTFPRIACEIDSSPASPSENADFTVTLKYHYELRSRLRINIVR